MPQYKYHKEIDSFKLVCKFPDVINIPEGKIGYRFVKKDDLRHSFEPPSIINPQRILPQSKIISGYALSFFEDKFQSEAFYHSLNKTFHNIKKTMGDSVGTVSLEIKDGMITHSEKNTHFDLFEFVNSNFEDRVTKIDLL